MIPELLAFIFGLLIAMVVQGFYLPWLHYRQARAKLLQAILTSRKAWLDDNPPADWWSQFRDSVNPIAEDLLQSRLAMLITFRRLTTYIEIVDKVKWLTRKGSESTHGREIIKSGLETVLQKLWVRSKSVYLGSKSE